MRKQAEKYGSKIVSDFVTNIERQVDNTFIVTLNSEEVLEIKTVILATGVVDIEPEHS